MTTDEEAMVLPRPHRTLVELLDGRRMLSVETATAQVAVTPDPDTVLQSVAATVSAGGTTFIAYSDRDSLTGKGNEIYLNTVSDDGLHGSPMQYNTSTSGSQMNPDLALNVTGQYVVVWQSENIDGSGWAIVARCYNHGNSAEIVVNQTTLGNQVMPKVASDSAGNFVVTWFAPDSNNGEIFARRFNASGTPLGNEFKVSGSSNFAYSAPVVAALDNGAFAFAWVKINNDTDSNTDVQFQTYDSSGNAVGSAVTVNTQTANDQAQPAIAAAGGHFVVAWSDSTGGDASIYHRVYDATGTALTVATQTSQDSVGNRSRPRVAGDASGNFVVGWTQQVQDAFDSSTVFRPYDANFAPTGNELANTDGQSARTLQDIVFTGQGAFRELSTLGETVGYGAGVSIGLQNVIRLDGTSGSDTVTAADLNSTTIRATINGSTQDFVRSAYADLRVALGDGNDTYHGENTSFGTQVDESAGDDTLYTGSGNDTISGGDGNDYINCGPGNDYAIGNGGDDQMYGGDGNDSLASGSGRNTLYGGNGDDRLTGSNGREIMYGEAGNDRLLGYAGNDYLDGGANGDRIYGGDGDDQLYGGGGKVTDYLYGEAGNDLLNGNLGDDLLNGGDGFDTVQKREVGDTLISIESF